MIGLKNLHPLDLRIGWTFAAGFAEACHGMLGAGEDRLDIAIAAIAHPAGNAARLGLLLRESAEADALHAAGDPDPNDFFLECS